MKKQMKLGSYKSNDVELCRTTSERVCTQAAKVLLEARVPFAKNNRRVPFYKRETYRGAERIWVITTNPHCYTQARRAIDRMESFCRERLVLSNY